MEQVFGKTQAYAPNRKLFGADRETYVSTMFLVTGELPEEGVVPFGFPLPESMKQYVDTVLRAKVNLSGEAVILTDAYAPLEAWSDAAVHAMRY